jgi:protein-tyrosine phosphatase
MSLVSEFALFDLADTFEGGEGYKRRRSIREHEDGPFKKVTKGGRLSPLKHSTSSRCSSPTLSSTSTPRSFFELEMKGIPQIREQITLERSLTMSGMSAQNLCRLYQQESSKMSNHLFLSSQSVAKDKTLLEKCKITHILNVSSLTTRNYYESEYIYKSWPLLDDGNQSLLSVLIESIAFMDVAISQGGNVLVHCEKGVSRSACFIIGYLMWKEGLTFAKSLDRVKSIRPIVSPNAGLLASRNYLFQFNRLNSYTPTCCYQLTNQYDPTIPSIYLGQDYLSCYKYTTDQDDLITSMKHLFSIKRVLYQQQSVFEREINGMNRNIPPLRVSSSPLHFYQEPLDQKRIKIYEFDEIDEYWEDCGCFSLDEFEQDSIYVILPAEDDESIYVWMQNDNEMEIHTYGDLFCRAKNLTRNIKRFSK